jgi:hypothetical protein
MLTNTPGNVMYCITTLKFDAPAGVKITLVSEIKISPEARVTSFPFIV